MPSDKSTWWSITEFDEDYMAILEDATKYPPWVEAVYGGREKCKETDRQHFQGALQTRGQHRFGKVKGWLPKAHIEACKKNEQGIVNSIALTKYAMKQDTADGEKVCRKNAVPFLDAQHICRLISSKVVDRQTDRQKQFWRAVEEIIVESPEMTGQLMNPSLKNFWVNTAKAWERLEQLECDSITHIPSDEPLLEEEDLNEHQRKARDFHRSMAKKSKLKVYNGDEEESVSQESESSEGVSSSEVGD